MLVLALMLILPSAAIAAEAERPLVVASLTQMSGTFTTNMWGNNTADVDMRLLLHSYPAIYENLNQQYERNNVALSNLVSNVPAVMLLLPHLGADPASSSVLLALVSTFAGNLITLGSIANLIVIEQARQHGVTLGFREHARAGVPVTLASLAILVAWLAVTR